ncbi:hypothetical protein [Streptomyces sp. NPDC002994]|uniref:hypothetical protein n=1 Tax=Streptomyces sp. NPDC002994 TaxID=3154441 RepID=UPI0033AE0226
MDGAGLTDHERRILTEIEQAARQNDGVLDLKLQTMRRWPAPAAQFRKGLRQRRGLVLLCSLGALCVSLLVPAVRTSVPAFVTAFALTWAVTLLYALRLVCRWSRRMSGPGSRSGQWE